MELFQNEREVYNVDTWKHFQFRVVHCIESSQGRSLSNVIINISTGPKNLLTKLNCLILCGGCMSHLTDRVSLCEAV